ncbi:MAG: hypothetical protein QM711_07355 [Micropruina sp.]|uniref:hypothetical protein n=1 Tax=Micropruina sp. TaxID=2737536 RepID=UPI0039E40B56
MTNQPTIPPIPSSDGYDDAESAATPEHEEGVVVIQDTEVIDATQIDTPVETPPAEA